MCIFGGDGGAGDEAKRARAEEAARQARIKTGIGGIDSAFSGFDSNFYDGRKQAYLNFAMPQLNEQHDDAYRGLTYQLARQGLNESSTGADRFGRLQKTYDMNRQGVVDKGMETANNARRDVENARSGLVADLYATSDPQSAARSATERAGYLATPTNTTPLGQLFANTLQGLGTYQGAQQDSQAYNDAVSRYNLSMGGPAVSSGRTVGR
jgi:hypothetical protein